MLLPLHCTVPESTSPRCFPEWVNFAGAGSIFSFLGADVFRCSLMPLFSILHQNRFMLGYPLSPTYTLVAVLSTAHTLTIPILPTLSIHALLLEDGLWLPLGLYSTQSSSGCQPTAKTRSSGCLIWSTLLHIHNTSIIYNSLLKRKSTCSNCRVT